MSICNNVDVEVKMSALSLSINIFFMKINPKTRNKNDMHEFYCHLYPRSLKSYLFISINRSHKLFAFFLLKNTFENT